MPRRSTCCSVPIPRTRILDPARGDEFWAARRNLFFKPVSGFGSRAAYRGDKLTRKVWRKSCGAST